MPNNSGKRETVVALFEHYLQCSLIEGRIKIRREVMISEGFEPLSDELEACLHALVVINTTKLRLSKTYLVFLNTMETKLLSKLLLFKNKTEASTKESG